jgi:predicted transcriptional regulator
MARTIVENHGLTEKQTADLLGLSQSAVSRYLGRERGNHLTLENSHQIKELINQMVTTLVKEPKNKTKVLELFCQTCITIRELGLMCPKCQQEMPKDWAEKCFFCREK